MHVRVCRYSNDELYEVPEGNDAPLSSETWSGKPDYNKVSRRILPHDIFMKLFFNRKRIFLLYSLLFPVTKIVYDYFYLELCPSAPSFRYPYYYVTVHSWNVLTVVTVRDIVTSFNCS